MSIFYRNVRFVLKTKNPNWQQFFWKYLNHCLPESLHWLNYGLCLDVGRQERLGGNRITKVLAAIDPKQFLLFIYFLRWIGQIVSWHPNKGSAPPSGKSWIRHWPVSKKITCKWITKWNFPLLVILTKYWIRERFQHTFYLWSWMSNIADLICQKLPSSSENLIQIHPQNKQYFVMIFYSHTFLHYLTIYFVSFREYKGKLLCQGHFNIVFSFIVDGVL